METQLKDYRPEVRSLFATLKRHGFKVRSFFDGEEYVPVDAPDFLEAVTGVEEGTLRVTREGMKESAKEPGKMVFATYGLYLVFGNSPGELVADYSIPQNESDAAAMEAATSEHHNRWDGRPQAIEIRET